MPHAIQAGTLWGPIPPAPPGWTWEGLMDKALTLAQKNADMDEVPVGALIVTATGELVGQGTNAPRKTHDPSAHAEILALRAAGKTLGNYRLGGCTMVVTLEPCLMCTGAIVHARLDGLVYGAVDQRAGAVSSALEGLALSAHTHRVWQMGGVRGQECAAVLQNFFQQRRDITGKPLNNS